MIACRGESLTISTFRSLTIPEQSGATEGLKVAPLTVSFEQLDAGASIIGAYRDKGFQEP